jgi:hypothetical protein
MPILARIAQREWLLLSAAVAALLAVGVAVADWTFRRTGSLLYPTLPLMDYSLRGLPLQALALAGAAASQALLWLARRRGWRAWSVVAALGMGAAIVTLVAAPRPYVPATSARIAGRVYQVAALHDSESPFDLYVVFACEPTGLVCTRYRASAPFDLATGARARGSETLTADPGRRTLTLRLGGHTIAVYHLTESRFSPPQAVGLEPRR